MLINLLISLLGRESTYRLGRRLYMQVRGDLPNDIYINGERMIQDRVINALIDMGSKNIIIFDVGANVGDWSSCIIELLRTIKNKKIIDLYLFEPVPTTLNILKNNLGDADWLHYESFALSSANNVGQMYICGDSAGTNSMYPLETGNHLTKIIVPKITVTEFCKERSIDHVDLLKCDTEGHDMDVFEGTLPMLRDGRISVMQFEYNHLWIFSRHFLKDIFDATVNIPYSLGKVFPDHVELYDRWCPEHDRFFEANYVLIRNDLLPWFKIIEVKLGAYNTLIG